MEMLLKKFTFLQPASQADILVTGLKFLSKRLAEGCHQPNLAFRIRGLYLIKFNSIFIVEGCIETIVAVIAVALPLLKLRS